MLKLPQTVLVLAAVGALACVGSAASAAPLAVTLPATDLIYQGNYDKSPSQMWTTASNGAAAVIGTPATTGLSQSTDGAWDPSTGKSYVIGNGYDGPCELWGADTTTGQFTFIANITASGGPSNNCDAFDIAPDGTAWITIYDTNTPSGSLAKLNLTDGTTTDLVALSGLTTAAPTFIAIQPTSGVMYLSDWSSNVFTVDTATGALTPFADGSGYEGPTPYDAAFDSAGRLWITTWGQTPALYSTDIADYANSMVLQGSILLPGDPNGETTGTDSLWIDRGVVAAVPVVPALASTGIDTTGPLGAGLGLLVLGFGAFALRRTRRTV